MQDLDDFAKSDLDKLERLADNFEWIHIDHDRLVKRLNITNYDESIAIEYIYN
jgi:hypothetical protein